jgi:hypothetical protein
MMVAIMLPPLLLDSILISAVLIVLNRRGVGVAASGGATIATSLVLMMVQWIAYGAAGSVRQILRSWLLWVLVPSAAVFALSRLGLFVGRPWLLLFLGPISFVVALVVVMIALNLSPGLKSFALPRP